MNILHWLKRQFHLNEEMAVAPDNVAMVHGRALTHGLTANCRNDMGVKLCQKPDARQIQSLFRELVRDEETGNMKPGKRFLWEVFSLGTDPENHTGFVVDALYSVTEGRSLSLLAQAIERGEPGGYSWSFDFDLSGDLKTIDKIIDTQNLTGDSDNFEMASADYFPGGSERQKNEGLQALQALLEMLATRKHRIPDNSRLASLFI